METYLRRQRTVDTQRVLPYTGEGAYHGSTKSRPRPAAPRPPAPVIAETRPRTLDAYARDGKTQIGEFAATFPNRCAIMEALPVPSQEAIAADAVTFVWCPFETARREAGPLTRTVLDAMAPHLTGTRRHVYIDSKIQHFRVGDLPVDSQIWHVDGSIVARDARVQDLGFALLHDMRARMDGEAPSPLYLAYQSSEGCATQYVSAPMTVSLPELIPNFDILDERVRDAQPAIHAQPPAAIVSFDGLSLHRAVKAQRDEWRLWIRCVETDREVHLSRSIIECYNTVFRTRQGTG